MVGVCVMCMEYIFSKHFVKSLRGSISFCGVFLGVCSGNMMSFYALKLEGKKETLKNLIY